LGVTATAVPVNTCNGNSSRLEQLAMQFVGQEKECNDWLQGYGTTIPHCLVSFVWPQASDPFEFSKCDPSSTQNTLKAKMKR
jgi:hypothetical protein